MKLSREQQSVVAIAAGLLLLAWLKHNYIFGWAALGLAATLPFVVLTTPIHKIWMGISKVLGFITSHIILSVLFFLLLTPISFFRKLSGKKDFMRHFPEQENSNFSQRNHAFIPGDFLNPW